MRNQRNSFTAEEREHWAREADERPCAEVAAEAGVHAGTIRNWRRQFITKVASVSRRGRRDVASTTDKRGLSAAFRDHEPELVTKTMELVRSSDPAAVAKGLQIALERGYGRPFQSSETDINVSNGSKHADDWIAALREEADVEPDSPPDDD